MKAKSVGLLAEDYTSDRVKDVSQLYTGRRILESTPEEIIDQMYRPPYEADIVMFASFEELLPNEYFILRSGKKSALATYNPFWY